ncbi:zinc finger X-chromosomal protein-like [Homalodisca vitripennis]|nr:zinc finger X-chromosomal protein-like [Homalodisca vitripennis]KAG8259377.1 hypothetical protein J6590_014847 [Homalodisca vitripennis]
MIVHSSEGDKFQCLSCDKSYHHKGNLIKHQKYECGDLRPFSCSFCPYRSKQKGNLKTHVAKKHPGHSLEDESSVFIIVPTPDVEYTPTDI